MSSSCSLRVRDMSTWPFWLPSCPHSSRKAGVRVKLGSPEPADLQTFSEMFLNCWQEHLLCYFPPFQCLLLKEKDILYILKGEVGKQGWGAHPDISSPLRVGNSHLPSQHLPPGKCPSHWLISFFPCPVATLFSNTWCTPPTLWRNLWRPIWLLPTVAMTGSELSVMFL